MIAAMDQVTVVGRRSLAKDVLASLQNLGVVQVESLDPSSALKEESGALKRVKLSGADGATKESWDRLAARTTALMDSLGIVPDGSVPGRAETNEDPSELEGHLAELGSLVDRLLAERSDLQDESELMRTFQPLLRDLAPLLAPLDGSRYLSGVAFLAPEKDVPEVAAKLKAELGDRFELASRRHAGEMLVVAASLQADAPALRSALSKAGMAELTLPDRYAAHGIAKAAHVIEERSQFVPKRLAAIKDELGRLGSQHEMRLRQLNRLALNQSERYHRLEDLAEGRYGFALRGWVPSADRPKVVSTLAQQFKSDIVVDARAADEHHDHGVPVKLENPGWVTPFQALLNLFAPPKYGSFDPSWTLAVFFPLYFGLVVGDIGFGLLFAFIATMFKRMGNAGKSLSLGPLGITFPAESLKNMSTLIYWCAAWSIVFGFMFGEFFGNFLEHFPPGKPIFYTTLHHDPGYGFINIPLFRVEVFTPLLLASIGFGVLQVIGGWVIRTIYGFKHHDMKHVYEGIGMVGGLSAVVLFAASYLNGNLTPVIMTIVVIGMVIFLAGAVLAKMPLMLVEIISNSGNILSYLRLFAVGLSAALVANLATDLGFSIAHMLPVLGPILGIVVGLAVHLVAMALTIIGHTLQPLRLQYVEFFTKFGFYDESGRPYQPFKLVGGK
ncbi:MAG: hypothetical protein KF813_07555 [Trueperaceae bacterium]|nr:hypothetical protein [Trueperaceae bacterium]